MGSSPSDGRDTSGPPDDLIVCHNACAAALEALAPLSRKRVFTHIVAKPIMSTMMAIADHLLRITKAEACENSNHRINIFFVVDHEVTAELLAHGLRSRNLLVQVHRGIPAETEAGDLYVATCNEIVTSIKQGQYPPRSITVLDIHCGRPTSDTMVAAAHLVELSRTASLTDVVHVIAVSTEPTPLWSESFLQTPRRACVDQDSDVGDSDVEETVAETRSIQLPSAELQQPRVYPTGHPTLNGALVDTIARSACFEDWDVLSPSRPLQKRPIIICPLEWPETFEVALRLRRSLDISESAMAQWKSHRLKLVFSTANPEPQLVWHDVVKESQLEPGDQLVVFVDPSLRFLPDAPRGTIWVIPSWVTHSYFDATRAISNHVTEVVHRTMDEVEAMSRLGGGNTTRLDFRVAEHANYRLSDSSVNRKLRTRNPLWDNHCPETFTRLLEKFSTLPASGLNLPKRDHQTEIQMRLFNQGMLEKEKDGILEPHPVRATKMMPYLNKYGKLGVAYLLSCVNPSNSPILNRTLVHLASLASVGVEGLLRYDPPPNTTRPPDLEERFRDCHYGHMCGYGYLWLIMALRDSLDDKDRATDGIAVFGKGVSLNMVNSMFVDEVFRAMLGDILDGYPDPEHHPLFVVDDRRLSDEHLQAFTEEVQEHMVIAWLWNLTLMRKVEGSHPETTTVVVPTVLQWDHQNCVDPIDVEKMNRFGICLGFKKNRDGYVPVGQTMVEGQSVLNALTRLWGHESAKRNWIAKLMTDYYIKGP